MDTAVIAARRQAGGKKIRVEAVLEAIQAGSPKQATRDTVRQESVAKEQERDLVLLSLILSDTCYVWAAATGKAEIPDAPEERRPLNVGGDVVYITVKPMDDGLTDERRAALRSMAQTARAELCQQTGIPDDYRHKPKLYETVKSTPRLMAWLQTMRYIP